MRSCVRLFCGEMRKYAHTSILWVHLILPLVGMAVFLLYYSFSAWKSGAKAQAYLEVLACIWPFLAGLICGMAVEMERNSGFQTFLLLPGRRWQALLGKWLCLMALGLIAALIAALGFGALFHLLPGGNVFSMKVYLLEAAVIWICQAPVYMLHLFLAAQFGRGASIGVGVGGAILAFLMLTGMGEGIWMYLPWSFGGRWCDFMLVYSLGAVDRAVLTGNAWPALVVCGGLTALIFGSSLFWMGRKNF